ncbi:MAG TPA: DUF3443 family protein [Candidatus Acidoferrales bacterium]|nr:DUF3443 family protein [Candidatus Acidoferrales bacterium]
MSRSRHPFAFLFRTALAAAAIAAGCGIIASCSRAPGSLTSTAPKVSLPASLPFGSIPQGLTSPVMMVTLTNTGTAPLTFTSTPSVSGTNHSDFLITASTCSTASQVAANSSCMVSLTFTPSTMTAESASLDFNDNASPSMQSVPLSGTGTAAAPVVSLSTNTLAFGPVMQGTTSAPLTVTVTNNGNATLIFSSAVSITGANSGDFTIVNVTQNTCAPANQVAPGNTCTVDVTFTPSTSGTESAVLNFMDNAAPAMQTVTLTGGASSTTNNMVTLTVDSGPLGDDLNIPFTSVTVCVPGSMVNCQTIDHILVDTGSSGLRILASQLNVSLPQATDGMGNPLGNCVQFADMSYAFGPVQTADIYLGGEKASSVPIQDIAAPGFASAPAGANGCVVTGGTNLNSVVAFGANGLIGVGLFRQDCGQACVGSQIPGTYYSCPNNVCSPTTVALTSQLQNPVWMFPQDNQGVLLTLPAVGAPGAASVTGSLIFGIGSQANNVLGPATVLTTDANGFITATYNTVSYISFIDSGSNGFFFLTTTETGLPNCNNFIGFYCPNSSVPFTIMNKGANNATASASFNIANIESLVTANPSFSAFGNAGGPFPSAVDYGLPFFYGRSVFTGIEGQTAGSFTGPYFAY